MLKEYEVSASLLDRIKVFDIRIPINACIKVKREVGVIFRIHAWGCETRVYTLSPQLFSLFVDGVVRK